MFLFSSLIVSFFFLTLFVLNKAILFMLQLGIRPRDDDITVEEAWDDIVERIKFIFSDEVSSSKGVPDFSSVFCKYWYIFLIDIIIY